MEIRTETEIAASPEKVWEILSDFGAYSEWNPLTIGVRGILEEGETVKLKVSLKGKTMKRLHKISRVDPGSAICWRIISPLPWLIRGERCQTIEAQENGHVVYRNCEGVEGLVGPLVSFFYGSAIRSALEALGQALKQRAES